MSGLKTYIAEKLFKIFCSNNVSIYLHVQEREGRPKIKLTKNNKSFFFLKELSRIKVNKIKIEQLKTQ